MRGRQCRAGEAAERDRRRDAAADDPTAKPAVAAAEQAAEHPDRHHADKPAAVLQRCEAGRLPWREAEQQPGERLDDQLLRAVGEHRDDHEDREAPRAPVGPDLAEGCLEARARCRLSGRRRRLDPGDPATASIHAATTTPATTASNRSGENGSSSRPATAVVTMKPTIIMIHASREQREQRRARGADPDPDRGKGRDCQRDAPRGRNPRRRPRREQRARGEHGHAADDPRRPPARPVRPVPPACARQLNRIMERDKRCGNGHR